MSISKKTLGLIGISIMEKEPENGGSANLEKRLTFKF
jgi:hypothetical protein